jgi:hypothetical protein
MNNKDTHKFSLPVKVFADPGHGQATRGKGVWSEDAIEAAIKQLHDSVALPSKVVHDEPSLPDVDIEVKGDNTDDAMRVLGHQVAKQMDEAVRNAVTSSDQKRHQDFINQLNHASVQASTAEPIVNLNHVVRNHSSEQIFKALAHKYGRHLSETAVREIFDYFHRKTLSIHTESVKFPPEDEKGLDMLKWQLEELPTVKVNIIFDDYPNTASIVIKVNTNALDDKESEEIPDRINNIINDYKPKGLEELEVIFHHKEVY